MEEKMTTTSEKQTTIRLGKRETTWSDLLRDAVSTPGKLLEAYTAFHNFSVGNSLLALFQCYDRGITPGPLNTYKGWQQLGRQVKKGEKAIVLCMPLACKKHVREEIHNPEQSGTNPPAQSEKDVCDEITRYRFALRPYWFVLPQTDGETAFTPSIPGFDLATALRELRIQRVEFESTNGNAQGYALERSIAINPVAQLPHKTTFHELAHIELGHTEEGQLVDSDLTPRNIREVEAESVALICCEALQLVGAEYARGYVQSWLAGESINDRSAQKIFSAASAILKAGRGESASRESG
jgi:N-terminal domain of anti-restriction factor ArdC